MSPLPEPTVPMPRLRPAVVRSIVGALLLLLLLQLVLSVRRESQTFDEAFHIYAGYSYWRHGDFGMCPSHPPVVRLLAAAPLLGMQLREPSQRNSTLMRDEFVQGRDFLYSNDAESILLRTRMAAALLTLLLAWLVYLMAREMFGQVAALVALAIIVFEPNILAHGALVTTDVGFSCFLLAAVYAFYRYVKVPTVWRLTTAGAALGLALVSKFTGIFVVPILVALAVCELVPSPPPPTEDVSQRKRAAGALMGLLLGCSVSFAALALLLGLTLGMSAGLMAAAQYTAMLVLPVLGLKALFTVLNSSPTPETFVRRRIHHAVQLAGALLAMGVIALVVLWSAYGFRYAARPGGMSMNPPLSELQNELNRPVEEHVISTCARWHLLPEAYLYGLVEIRTTLDRPTYLLGRSYLGGRWFYFPLAFLIKSTSPFLLMLALAAFVIGLSQFSARREILSLLVPAVFYFWAAMSGGLNIGIRHLLPVYPLLAVLVGGAAAALIRHRRRWAYVVAILLVWHAASSMRSFPTYLAYANEFWGGPSQTYRYLSDSNVDWGQQLKSVAHYLDQRGIKNCYFAYTMGGLVNLNYYGIPCKPLVITRLVESWVEVPSNMDGTVLISATVLSGSAVGPGELNPFVQFQKLRPSEAVDHGVFVFDGHYDIALVPALNRAKRADLLMEQGLLDEALGEAQQAVDTAPNSIQAQLVLGQVLNKLNRPADAQVAYQKALLLAEALGPENKDWIDAVKASLPATSSK